ncbi:MAG: hypothetical protein HZB46_13630, partial [Solirubrobacterales bacterium]|nr:hypothetical protein [Solirubrobacterales bacterium]
MSPVTIDPQAPPETPVETPAASAEAVRREWLLVGLGLVGLLAILAITL